VEHLTITGVTSVVPAAGDITPAGSGTGTGSTIVPFTPTANFGGILTSPANIGHQERSVFTVLSEVNFDVGVDVTSYLRLTVGYTLLYWGNVLRPGNQIESLVNQKWIPSGVTFDNVFNGNPYPRILWRQSDFWAQGISFGAELHY
jgi:hypothetical protein